MHTDKYHLNKSINKHSILYMFHNYFTCQWCLGQRKWKSRRGL